MQQILTSFWIRSEKQAGTRGQLAASSKRKLRSKCLERDEMGYLLMRMRTAQVLIWVKDLQIVDMQQNLLSWMLWRCLQLQMVAKVEISGMRHGRDYHSTTRNSGRDIWVKSLHISDVQQDLVLFISNGKEIQRGGCQLAAGSKQKLGSTLPFTPFALTTQYLDQILGKAIRANRLNIFDAQQNSITVF